MSADTTIVLDELNQACLDGVWEFFPGARERTELSRLTPEPIRVPGLWEAQGYPDLDGTSWYRKQFTLSDVDGHWTLRFGAVMDIAEVYLNGEFLGRHEHPFTPFDLDATGHLRAGVNRLEVKVDDPAVHDVEHRQLMHGKQGWANHVFPSRPSLYLTYGGIWQSVQLRRHGPAVVRSMFVNADPDDLSVTVELANISARPIQPTVELRAVGRLHEVSTEVPAGDTRTVTWQLGPTAAARWNPESPALHTLWADLRVDGDLSDQARERFGLRTVRIEDTRLLLNGRPYRMKSALVQGFTADLLYAEGDRAAITAEVRSAQALGFNTLRLHIKAFDPVYLDVCDELGMLLHCDLPIAEPIEHDELGDGTVLSRRAVEAATEQVRRDRNHPSIVLWSAMNELGLDRDGVRDTEAYEQFARTVYRAVVDADPTRPVIENDWVEPDPQRVFESPVLTAHWYGRLHADYLHALDDNAGRWSAVGRPLFITEFGDWGLPDMTGGPGAPFWHAGELYSAGLAASGWPGTMARFVAETQRYQGVSDRLQTETIRRHDHLGGYCLTELTDVPHEFNGLLDLERNPKPMAVTEVTRANQPRLPMLKLGSLVMLAGEQLTAEVYVANDGPPVADASVVARFGTSTADPTTISPSSVDGSAAGTCQLRLGDLAGYQVWRGGQLSLTVPKVTGNHDLILLLQTPDGVLGENRYPIHVVKQPAVPYTAAVLGDGPTRDVLRDLGVVSGDDGITVVGESALTERVGIEVGRRLARGGTVLMLAQPPAAAMYFPLPTRLVAVDTAWGSSVFHFTTDSGALTALPRRNLIVGEDSTIQATSIVVSIGGDVFPHEAAVIAYKPTPGAVTGTIVGAHRVNAGRLIVCQYRLVEPAAAGDPAARALLADLLRWAADPPAVRHRRTERMADGHTVSFYSWSNA